jgi:hypothetical protein
MITENEKSVIRQQFSSGLNIMAKIITYLTENLVSIYLPVQYWVGLYVKIKNTSYRKTMNTENLVSIHLSVQYCKLLYGKNNNVSYRNTMVTEI